MAKLIELVKERENGFEENDLDHGHEFLDFEDFKVEQENPVLQYIGFGGLGSLNVKGVALEKLNNSLREMEITGWRDESSIEKLEENLRERLINLENFKFKNYHAFWTKDYWYNIMPSPSPNRHSGGVLDLFSAGSLVASITANPFFLAATGVSLVGNEVVRRLGKNSNQFGVKKIQGRLDTYDIFKENIGKSKLEVIDAPEARDIIDSIKKVKGNSPYSMLNYGKINGDLREIYKECLEK